MTQESLAAQRSAPHGGSRRGSDYVQKPRLRRHHSEAASTARPWVPSSGAQPTISQAAGVCASQHKQAADGDYGSFSDQTVVACWAAVSVSCTSVSGQDRRAQCASLIAPYRCVRSHSGVPPPRPSASPMTGSAASRPPAGSPSGLRRHGSTPRARRNSAFAHPI